MKTEIPRGVAAYIMHKPWVKAPVGLNAPPQPTEKATTVSPPDASWQQAPAQCISPGPTLLPHHVLVYCCSIQQHVMVVVVVVAGVVVVALTTTSCPAPIVMFPRTGEAYDWGPLRRHFRWQLRRVCLNFHAPHDFQGDASFACWFSPGVGRFVEVVTVPGSRPTTAIHHPRERGEASASRFLSPLNSTIRVLPRPFFWMFGGR